MIRRRYVLHGSVQGVGLRWRARHAAGLYGCTGLCRNETDGSVTLEIQGSAEAVDAVVRAVADNPWGRVERMEEDAIPVEEREYGFGTE